MFTTNKEDDTLVEHFKSSIDRIAAQMHNERHTQLTAGLGTLCHMVGDYRCGYAEASEILDMGRRLHRKSGCTHFNKQCSKDTRTA